MEQLLIKTQSQETKESASLHINNVTKACTDVTISINIVTTCCTIVTCCQNNLILRGIILYTIIEI